MLNFQGDSRRDRCTYSTAGLYIIAKDPSEGNTVSRSYWSMCSENIIGMVNILHKGRKSYTELNLLGGVFFFFSLLFFSFRSDIGDGAAELGKVG